MRRLLRGIAFILLLTVLGGCAAPSVPVPENTETPVEKTAELRGIWISCYELEQLPADNDSSFRTAANAMFRAVRDYGLTDVFVHVRPFSDAFYPSKLFPYSKYLSCDGAPSFDPLAVLLDAAHACGLRFHAWINPFRVSYKTDVDALPDGCPAKQWLTDDDPSNDSAVSVMEDVGIFYAPASPAAHKLICDGVRELLCYEIDGVHIDDYFYPTTAAAFDRTAYRAYRDKGGALPLAQWRRENINAFVGGLYTLVKQQNPAVCVSISPSANLKKNYDAYYADAALWCRVPGYADLLLPQLYFGFSHDTLPFAETVAQWAALERCDKVRLGGGLAAYKCGTSDRYAGNGASEWIENSDLLSRQVTLLRQTDGFDGFVLFSFAAFFGKSVSKQAQNEKISLAFLL